VGRRGISRRCGPEKRRVGCRWAQKKGSNSQRGRKHSSSGRAKLIPQASGLREAPQQKLSKVPIFQTRVGMWERTEGAAQKRIGFCLNERRRKGSSPREIWRTACSFTTEEKGTAEEGKPEQKVTTNLNTYAELNDGRECKERSKRKGLRCLSKRRAGGYVSD